MRALRKATPKFLDDKYNFLVIADEETIGISLYMNPLMEHYRVPETCLDNPEFENVSAILILGGFYKEQMYKFKTWMNPSPKKSLSKEINDVISEYKAE